MSFERRQNKKRVGTGRAGSRGKAGAGADERRMVLIDQAPLRKKAATECAREMDRLEQARAEWARFERDDVPAFREWLVQVFGAKLSELRELDELIRQKGGLVHEVEMEVNFGGSRSYSGAYARVQRRRRAAAERVEQEDWSEPQADWEEEVEMMFREFSKVFMGIDPDRLSKAQYAKKFAEFKEGVQGGRENEGQKPGGRNGAQQRDAGGPPRRTPEAPKPEQARIKEVYRILVRRLHPDAREDSEAAVSHLWHEVQEAYGRGNLERLEMLLALTEVRSEGDGAQTTLSQMRSVLRELRRAFNAVQRSLKEAKNEPAWQFSLITNHAKLRTRLERQFEADLRMQRQELDILEDLLERWSRTAKKPKPAAKKKASGR